MVDKNPYIWKDSLSKFFHKIEFIEEKVFQTILKDMIDALIIATKVDNFEMDLNTYNQSKEMQELYDNMKSYLVLLNKEYLEMATTTDFQKF